MGIFRNDRLVYNHLKMKIASVKNSFTELSITSLIVIIPDFVLLWAELHML